MSKSLGLNVDIKRLKIWVSANLPTSSHLREVLLIEDDSLPAEEFLVKLKIWLKLFDLENEQMPKR